MLGAGQGGVDMPALALLGQRIRFHRLQHRQSFADRPWSQEDLAVAIGSDKAHVNRLECGRQCPAPETLNRICDALELPWPARRRLLGLAGLLEGPPGPGPDEAVRVAALLDRVLLPLPYPAYAVDQEGRICDANEAFARLFLDYPDRAHCLAEVRGRFLLDLMCERHRAGRRLRDALEDFDGLALRHLLVLRRAFQRQPVAPGLLALLDAVLADRRLCGLWLRHSANLDRDEMPDFLDHQRIVVRRSAVGAYAVDLWRAVLSADERFGVVHLAPADERMRARFAATLRPRAAGMVGGATAAVMPLTTRRRSSFPDRALTLTVPWAVGGVTDLGARLIAPVVARHLGQPVRVVNRDEEQSAAWLREMAAQPANGYHLAVINEPALDAAGPGARVREAFAFVATQAFDPFGIFVRPECRYASLRDLVRDAQRRPGEITIGTSGPCTPAHLAGLMLEEVAGIRFRFRHFRGSMEHMARFLAGQTDIAFVGSGITLRAVRADELRAIGMFTDQRFALLPEVPTLAEAGFPGLTLASVRAVFAPAGTPEAVLRVLRAAFAEAVVDSEHAAAMHAAGLGPLSLDEAALRRFCEEQSRRYRHLLPGTA
ncbi:tripartite tricarboxylate transporter substrate-binding protein [Falsiroseomonas sp.]|uniref:tripartite tricarboxylate transporter substrate-binding protein n=1 Tax=Falsiroseomonas sp. TaxID=2870721 RepID=UPI0034A27F15